jgi:hypothetical protein
MRNPTAYKKLALYSLLALSLTACARRMTSHRQNQPLAKTELSPEQPLVRAYAHNDYLHKHPLYDALENGFSCVEADVFLRNDKDVTEEKKEKHPGQHCKDLYIAHLFTGIAAGVTLRSLYLKSLLQRIQQNNGHVYLNSQESFMLLVDIKSGGYETYLEVEEELEEYKSILTSFDDNGVVKEGPVTVLISGNMPPERAMKAKPIRYCGRDGRLLPNIRSFFMPMISKDANTLMVSVNWNKYIPWRGVGKMPKDQELKLLKMVQAVHENGKQIRFWGIPENSPEVCDAIWGEELKAGVDKISTDKLPQYCRNCMIGL